MSNAKVRFAHYNVARGENLDEFDSEKRMSRAERITVIGILVGAIFGYSTILSDLNERISTLEKTQEIELKHIAIYTDRLRIALDDVRKYFIRKVEYEERPRNDK